MDAGKAMDVAPQQLCRGCTDGAMTGQVPKNSEHPSVFRSLKRTHDMLADDHANPIPLDEESHRVRRAGRLGTEYGSVLHLPALQQNLQEKGGPSTSWDPYGHQQPPADGGQEVVYMITVRYPCPSVPGVPLTAYTKVQRLTSEPAAPSQALAPPASQEMHGNWTAAGVGDTYRPAGISEPLQPTAMSAAVREDGEYKNSAYRLKPVSTVRNHPWHQPWTLSRVIRGHQAWVRCIAVEPRNEWFVTGSSDRTIKIWDLASCEMLLSLGGHKGAIQGVTLSPKTSHLFSCGGCSEVKCWDLEYRKVVRQYDGHVGVVYGLDLHPTMDVLVTCSRDLTTRVWDARSKSQVHTLKGHTDSVAAVKCHATEAQIITGSYDSTIRIWDLAATKTRLTLTHNKKPVRTILLDPTCSTLASGSLAEIKRWKLPDGDLIQTITGHNAAMNTLAVSSNDVLVSGASDGSMHAWDWTTGSHFQKIKSGERTDYLDRASGIFACVFDQSGSRLLTAEADKTIHIYTEDFTIPKYTCRVSMKKQPRRRKRF
ncbi:pleiotropic regulator 1-like [Hirundo rustica]|uniref:pleiotropic regulator 1-like n=1 Tax=Hirundo rustica TaxID=43150 RepID=UPI001A9458CA|nr:pleiotropic regulator 1-like [Hirundo rustica]